MVDDSSTCTCHVHVHVHDPLAGAVCSVLAPLEIDPPCMRASASTCEAKPLKRVAQQHTE